MSKKSSGALTSTVLVRTMAYVALVLAVLLTMVQFVCNCFDIALGIIGTLNLVRDICSLLVVILAAYEFTIGKTKTWRYLYWACVIILIVFYVLLKINIKI